MRPALLLLALGAWALGACASPPDRMTIDALPLPPYAEAGAFEGGFEVRIDRTMNALRAFLFEDYGAADAEFFRLKDGVRWEQVDAFYSDALAAAGFERAPATSTDPGLYDSALWTRDRLLGPDEAVAVAMTPGREGDPWSFLVLLHAPRDDR